MVTVFYSVISVREHRQKVFVKLSGFWPLKVLRGWVNPLKKRKFVTKIFFEIMLNKVLKSCIK